MQFKNLFRLKHEVSKPWIITLEISGVLLLLLAWQYISNKYGEAILPSPSQVYSATGEMLEGSKEMKGQDKLIPNLIYSIKINYWSYLKAAFYAILIGFPIGLMPFFKHLTNRHIDALRFIPLTAVTGLFIAWYGIEDEMRINFLTFGIFVYLLPVVVQRVSDVEDIYVQTGHTMGCSYWQKIRYIYFPSVSSKVFDDFRVLVAISWTYIIVAEMVNKENGVGALIFTAARQSRLDKVFAILIVIIIVGFLQDKLFKWVDKQLFKHKYV